MLMDEVSRVMKEYFKTVSPEQLEKDLKEAGWDNLPELHKSPTIPKAREELLRERYYARQLGIAWGILEGMKKENDESYQEFAKAMAEEATDKYFNSAFYQNGEKEETEPNMKLCPKCGSLSYFSSYFQKWMCNTCEHAWKEG